MQPVLPGATSYDRMTIVLHWTVVFLVVEQFLGAQIIDWFPRGPLRTDARSVHIVLGVTLAAVLAVRIAWRLTLGRQLAADRGLLNHAARFVHQLLYVLLIAMVLVGIVLTSARGDSIFGAFSVWSFSPGNRAPADWIGEVHETLAWTIIVVAALHAVAALFHRMILKDQVLQRMWPNG
jgi:cytochrome b561